jgi:hypothetical protein
MIESPAEIDNRVILSINELLTCEQEQREGSARHVEHETNDLKKGKENDRNDRMGSAFNVATPGKTFGQSSHSGHDILKSQGMRTLAPSRISPPT